MSALGAVVAGSVSRLWQVSAVILAGLVLAVGSCLGTGWWLAAAARDRAVEALEKERQVSAELRIGIGTQNAAIGVLGQQKLEAEERGRNAQAAAAATGRRYDAALQRLDGARATSCSDAMPFVDRLLEDVR